MSDATRLRGDGQPITMVDGTTETLVFDFDALCEVEELFGSLSAFTSLLTTGARGPILNTVAKGVSAGLRHLPEPPTVADVRRRLDSRLSREYVDALDTAFYDAMPAAQEGDENETEGKGSGETSDSPGASTTTSPPSSSVEATASSGA